MAQLFIGTRHALGFGMLAVYERNIMLIPEIELPIRNADLPREIDSKDRHEVILLIIIIFVTFLEFDADFTIFYL